MFKFEDTKDGNCIPTLTLFTRFASPKELPPPPGPPRKNLKEKSTPKWQNEWAPVLVPVRIAGK